MNEVRGRFGYFAKFYEAPVLEGALLNPITYQNGGKQ